MRSPVPGSIPRATLRQRGFSKREPRGVLAADIDCDGEMWCVVTSHLALAPRERRGQVEQVLQGFEAPAMPATLPGALNAWPVDGWTLRRLLSHFYRACAPRTFPARCPLCAFNLIAMLPGERLAGVNVHRSSHVTGGIGSLCVDREATHVAIKLTLVTKTP